MRHNSNECCCCLSCDISVVTATEATAEVLDWTEGLVVSLEANTGGVSRPQTNWLLAE